VSRSLIVKLRWALPERFRRPDRAPPESYLSTVARMSAVGPQADVRLRPETDIRARPGSVDIDLSQCPWAHAVTSLLRRSELLPPAPGHGQRWIGRRPGGALPGLHAAGLPVAASRLPAMVKVASRHGPYVCFDPKQTSELGRVRRRSALDLTRRALSSDLSACCPSAASAATMVASAS
jgi:hypothetical protein